MNDIRQNAILKHKIAKLLDLQHWASSAVDYESACSLRQQTFNMYNEVCKDVDKLCEQLEGKE